MTNQEALIRQLRVCVMAGDPLVVVTSRDHYEATLNMIDLCDKHGWPLLTHKPSVGLLPSSAALAYYLTNGKLDESAAKPSSGPAAVSGGMPASAGTAQAVIAALRAFVELRLKQGTSAVLVLHNVHRLLVESMSLVQTLIDLQGVTKAQGKTVVVLTHPSARLPEELEPYCTRLAHAEPTVDELKKIVASVSLDDTDPPPPELVESTACAAAGLQRQQAESAVARSFMLNGKLVPSYVWEYKVELSNHEGLVRVHKPTAGLSQLGGLHFFKDVVAKQVKAGNLPKILSVGAPGCGKTAGAFALGYEYGLNVLEACLGTLFGKYVGESEARTRQMQEIIEVNSPCIVVMDELPRYLSTDSAGGADRTGGDVNAKVAAEWLTWLSSPRARDVMIVATANDWGGIRTLTRAKRFTFCTYTSIHSTEEKLKSIWDIHLAGYGHGQIDPELYGWLIGESQCWTGAEIEAICELSSKKWLDEPIVDTINRVGIGWDSPDTREALEAMEYRGRNSSFIDIETGYKFSRRKVGEHAEVGVVTKKTTKRRVRRDDK